MTQQLPTCGHGVFVLNAAGGMEPLPTWQASIDALCVAVARATGQATVVRYRAHPDAAFVSPGVPRIVYLDVSGPAGDVFLNISISTRGNPAVIEEHDLPNLDLGQVKPGADFEFWLANESDTLCLAARLLAALDQGAAFRAESSFGPSTRAR